MRPSLFAHSQNFSVKTGLFYSRSKMTETCMTYRRFFKSTNKLSYQNQIKNYFWCKWKKSWEPLGKRKKHKWIGRSIDFIQTKNYIQRMRSKLISRLWLCSLKTVTEFYLITLSIITCLFPSELRDQNQSAIWIKGGGVKTILPGLIYHSFCRKWMRILS